MVRRIEAAGLRCYLRYVENDFKLPYFVAFVLEEDELSPVSVTGGHGFHPNRDIAAIRAIAEAVQSRLSFIHGGRDDIIERYDWEKKVGADTSIACTRGVRNAASRDTVTIPYGATASAEVQTIQSALDVMFDALRNIGLHHVVRVQFTDDAYPFQVVKVVIPGAEFYEIKMKRVGPRLMEFIKLVKAKKEEVAHV
jgi:ribosomal protein S12 methylthiotransferase accessory factor